MSSEYARRLEAYLEHLYLMATTFSALSLYERPAIGDTLLSLTCSFLSRSSGALLLRSGDALEPFATRDGVRMARHHMFFTDVKARRELGYTARPYQEGIADAIAWFRQSGYLR